MYGLMVNRIPAEINRIAEALGATKHAVAIQYLNYIFEHYLDDGARQFSIHDFLSIESEMDNGMFQEVLDRLENEVDPNNNVASIVVKLGGSSGSVTMTHYQELFQSGLRAMLASLNGMHDILQVSMESLRIKFRMYLSHYIVEYDTTGTIFDDHDEVIEVAVKSLSELEYF